jgi:Beta-lactamase
MISGQEIGAAVAVYRDGVKVVDLWGGYRNGITTGPWRDDTLVTMFHHKRCVVAGGRSRRFSGSDLLRRETGRLLDRVCTSRQGAVTVRQLLSHQAGLPARQARLLATHGGSRCLVSLD